MAILLGFFLGHIWVSLIFAAVVVAIILTTPLPKATGSEEAGPIVRPVIVQRKYVGPESIYPEKMKVKIAEPPPNMYETGLAPVGDFMGKGLSALLGGKKK